MPSQLLPRTPALTLNLALDLLLPLILSLPLFTTALWYPVFRHPASGWVGGRTVQTFKRSTL